MYPVSRLLMTTLRANVRKPLAVDGVSEILFYCRPWDIDMFMEMNNGRILTLFDLGRFDLSIRTGLSKILRQNRWGLAVAGGSARYRKRVRMLDKVTMRTQLAGVDDKWFFVSQSMWVKGQPTSSALLRTCITKGGRALPSSEVRLWK